MKRFIDWFTDLIRVSDIIEKNKIWRITRLILNLSYSKFWVNLCPT